MTNTSPQGELSKNHVDCGIKAHLTVMKLAWHLQNDRKTRLCSTIYHNFCLRNIGMSFLSGISTKLNMKPN